MLTPELVSDPKVLAALAHKGLPVPHRVRLKEDEARLTNEQRVIVGTARLLMGIQFWRDEDFDAAAALLAKVEPRAGEPRFLLALAQGLRRGPDDVAKLMLQNEGFGSGFGDVRALDVVASEQASEAIGARAAYDAAVIRQIAAPRDAKAEYWEALAKRYEKAESMLGDPTAKLEAHQRAKAAHATAAVLAKSER